MNPNASPKEIDNKPQRVHFLPRAPARVLVFSPLAWLKLLFFLYAGDTEVGGFGISSAEDPLYVEDFHTVEQKTTAASVEFDDVAVADYFDACVDGGLQPQRFARLWVHTHPGESATPSLIDEETFDRVFGRNDWAVMFILSRTRQTYCRLSFSAGPGGQLPLEVGVDWKGWPQAALEQAIDFSRRVQGWVSEYGQNVHPETPGPLAQMFLEEPLGWWDERELEEWAERSGFREEGKVSP
ncbi:MAG TPA: hypothetical protein VK797_25395 [Tepidisphaeraceae bacterium]|jgi:hypothetical protein|nr:hypothetical protein [Tepidisphaeraceae bacterium]